MHIVYNIGLGLIYFSLFITLVIIFSMFTSGIVSGVIFAPLLTLFIVGLIMVSVGDKQGKSEKHTNRNTTPITVPPIIK